MKAPRTAIASPVEQTCYSIRHVGSAGGGSAGVVAHRVALATDCRLDSVESTDGSCRKDADLFCYAHL